MLAQAAKIAGLALVVYAAVALGLYLIQRKMMYFPAPGLPPPPPPFEAVTLHTADGLDLVSWYAPAAESRRTLVYFQGNGGGIADRPFKVRPFLDAGYGVLLVGYRGYGGNPGTPSEAGLIADGRAALAFLAARGIPPTRVVLVGESLGSGVAVALAAERPVGALILEAPFTSAVDVARRLYFWLPVGLLMKDRFESIARIGKVRAPLLVVHGERDATVPVGLGRRLLAAAAEPKQGVFLPHAGHNDMTDHGLVEAELAFLEGSRVGRVGRAARRRVRGSAGGPDCYAFRNVNHSGRCCDGTAERRLPPMRIGIDLDNTIVSYDGLFADLAAELGLLPSRLAGGKRAVRDALRARPGGEATWQRLQAAAYGRQMARAPMFAGVGQFLDRCRNAGIEVRIISHKTRYAAADPDGVDLHRAALAWMRARGFFDDDRFGLTPSDVHFEATRADKLGRIAATGCSHFIDDLDEVLSDPAFPAGVARFLFAPDGGAPGGPYVICRSWREISNELFAVA